MTSEYFIYWSARSFWLYFCKDNKQKENDISKPSKHLKGFNKDKCGQAFKLNVISCVNTTLSPGTTILYQNKLMREKAHMWAH